MFVTKDKTTGTWLQALLVIILCSYACLFHINVSDCETCWAGQEKKLSIMEFVKVMLGPDAPHDALLEAAFEVLKELEGRQWVNNMPTS